MRSPLVTHFDAYPDRAQYKPNQSGNLFIELETREDAALQLVVAFSKLERPVAEEKVTIQANKGVKQIVPVPLFLEETVWSGYGVKVTVLREGEVVSTAFTSYDIADHWSRAPRYGFLSDFRSEESGDLRDVESMNKFHLNVIQFYDWMYRHDELVPQQDEFMDPMGREMSYQVVREKLEAVHNKGMAALAYGAVYASLKDFLQARPDWGLYNRRGEPFHLIDLFYIMDITPNSPWTDHIIEQFRQAVQAGFDGIHMDQYGFPKKAIRRIEGLEETVDLAECYPPLIDRTSAAVKEIQAEAGVIFNNVGNYPIRKTASTDQEALYIEVWPPVVRLRELKGLIDNARSLNPEKPIILSAYLPSFYPKAGHDKEWAENGALLTMAAIFASGGYHLLLGEDKGMLTMPYYPDYAVMRPEFEAEVRRYYDFIVRFGTLIHDPRLEDVSYTYTAGVNTEITLEAAVPFAPNGEAGSVWTVIKRKPGYQILQLINLVGLEDDYWEHGKHRRPEPQHGVVCHFLIEQPIETIYAASPDDPNQEVCFLDYEIVPHEQGLAARFVLPALEIWSMVIVKFRE
ncbi:glycoside hydrolase family 66 protein [Paenibacillus timonensis]|uniref:Glycoside hydrolase family 66 protein n=1 Tax=Paenibacillus timonensis TaxID=225915 RepID=A0ABW3S5Y3_9BACL|nr:MULTISPECIES: glycoside hydrolase family 66 protein [Paenibacillus]MCH1638509.1 glycoside hydrolase family 66 protein [Paenibacillus timonensis]MDU2242070.1 glycoside hydrolase family 66 protein [Paenibacillus sp.]